MVPSQSKWGVGAGWGLYGRHSHLYTRGCTKFPKKINNLRCLLTTLTCFGNLITVNEAETPRETQLNLIGICIMTKIITAVSKSISSAVSASVQQWAKAEDKQKGRLVLIADALVADGLGDPKLFEGAGKGKEQTKPFATTMLALISALPVAKQKILRADTKLLTKEQKAAKRSYTNEATSKMNKIRVELMGRLTGDAATAYAKHLEDKKKQRATGGNTSQTTKTPAKTPAAPSAPDATGSTPLKSYIEKVSTGYEILKPISPTSLTGVKREKINKLIGDLVEELKSIK